MTQTDSARLTDAEIRRYMRVSRCPKCGEEDIHTCWCRNVYHYREGWITGEHMHRTCQNCSYGWIERPLDYDDPEEATP